MGYDIGLKPINNSIRIESRAKFEQEIQVSWAIDMVTTYMLEGVTPLSDAIMMRLYAASYRKNIIGLNEEKLTSLASSYQQGIKCFFYQNLFNKLNDIILRWEAIVNAVPDGETFFSIPTNSTTAFNNLLTYHKMDPSADDTLQFNAFKSTLVANATEWFKAWYEDFDISKYIIPKDRFLLFINIVKEKVIACYQRSNSSDSIATDYHTKLNVAIDYIKALLMIVHQTNIESREDAKKVVVFDEDDQIGDNQSAKKGAFSLVDEGKQSDYNYYFKIYKADNDTKAVKVDVASSKQSNATVYTAFIATLGTTNYLTAGTDLTNAKLPYCLFLIPLDTFFVHKLK